MTLYPQMFISKWHLITVAMIAIAWLSLIIGGYERREVLRSGLGATVILYIMTTIPIATITFERLTLDDWMRGVSNAHYETKKERMGNTMTELDRLTVALGSYEDRDDSSFEMLIYVGNYNDSYRFRGSLVVRTYDEQGKQLDERSFEQLIIEPGEIRKIDSFFRYEDFSTYRYNFVPD